MSTIKALLFVSYLFFLFLGEEFYIWQYTFTSGKYLNRLYYLISSVRKAWAVQLSSSFFWRVAPPRGKGCHHVVIGRREISKETSLKKDSPQALRFSEETELLRERVWRVVRRVCPSGMEPKRIREGYLVKKVSSEALTRVDKPRQLDRGLPRIRARFLLCPSLAGIFYVGSIALEWGNDASYSRCAGVGQPPQVPRHLLNLSQASEHLSFQAWEFQTAGVEGKTPEGRCAR